MFSLTEPRTEADDVVVLLGDLGVTRPSRSRQSRIVTHNLNDRSFINQYQGRSPIRWQMSGEFVTSRDPFRRASARPLLQYRQLDNWGRDGTVLTLRQVAGNRELGQCRIQQLSDSGEVMEGQTLTTRWQMTLLFEQARLADGRPAVGQPGGGPAVSLVDVPPAAIGGSPSVPPPADGDDTTVIPPTQPAGPTTVGGLTVGITNVTSGVPIRLAFNQDAYAIPRTITDPVDDSVVTVALTSGLVVTVTPVAQSGAQTPDWGYYLWTEQWDGTAWQHLDSSNPSYRYPASSLSHSYAVARGRTDRWNYYRVRLVWTTIRRDSLNRPLPAVSIAPSLFQQVATSSVVAVFWGDAAMATEASYNAGLPGATTSPMAPGPARNPRRLALTDNEGNSPISEAAYDSLDRSVFTINPKVSSGLQQTGFTNELYLDAFLPYVAPSLAAPNWSAWVQFQDWDDTLSGWRGIATDRVVSTGVDQMTRITVRAAGPTVPVSLAGRVATVPFSTGKWKWFRFRVLWADSATQPSAELTGAELSTLVAVWFDADRPSAAPTPLPPA